MIKLKKDINIKKIRKDENPDKIVYIVEKILNVNKQQKGKGLPSDLARIARVVRVVKVSDCEVSNNSNLKTNPKEMLQKLPIALAQVKVSNKSQNLLNEIR